mgnify:CR=1 FL=1
MLQLLLGGSGSGKTMLLYQRIRARAEKGEKSILLVPEQFTSSTEGRIYRELGDALSGMVESFSFTSLAEKILSTEGGAAVQTLSDAGRAVLVRRALEELQDNVHYYHRHRRSAAFCQMAAQTIDELKSAGLSGQQLAQALRERGVECEYADPRYVVLMPSAESSAAEFACLQTALHAICDEAPAADVSVTADDPAAFAALAGALEGPHAGAAMKALLAFNGQINPEVERLLAKDDAGVLVPALKLAAARRMSAAADRVFALLGSSDAEVRAAAYGALPFVAQPQHMDRLSALLDASDEAQIGRAHV